MKQLSIKKLQRSLIFVEKSGANHLEVPAKHHINLERLFKKKTGDFKKSPGFYKSKNYFFKVAVFNPLAEADKTTSSVLSSF